jgi:hypothetical protein
MKLLYAPFYVKEVGKYLEWASKQKRHLPKLESLAIFLGVASDTVSSWMRKYPDFANACKAVKDKQAVQLIDDGIYGGRDVNTGIVKLLLQNNHGMKERSDVTTDDKPIAPTEIKWTVIKGEKDEQHNS